MEKEKRFKKDLITVSARIGPVTQQAIKELALSQTRFNNKTKYSDCLREIIKSGIKGFYQDLKEKGEI